MTKIPKEEEEIYTFKILFLGDTSSEKAQFISLFCDDKFQEEFETIIGLDPTNK